MKGIFKLTTAALALVALASCSNDELFGDPNANTGVPAIAKQGEMIVEVEDETDALTTRTAYVGNQIYWEDGDQIIVYDDAVAKYDKYAFDEDAGKFVLSGGKKKSNIAEPVYALFNHNEGSEQWNYSTGKTTATFNISAAWDWSETNVDVNSTETPAYASELPLWGTVEATEDGGIKASLKYLTAVLKVNMKNVPGNASTITVTGYANQGATQYRQLNGTFSATLADADGVIATSQLEPTLTTVTAADATITVDVSAAEDTVSVLYIPVIAQKYGLLTVSVDGKVVKKWPNQTLKRGTFYNVNIDEFETAGDTPSAITKALVSKINNEEVVMDCAQATTVQKGDGKDNTITLPYSDKLKTIVLNLKQLKGNVSDATLYVEDNAIESYSGTFVLNVGTTAATNISNVNINLPNATVIVAGNLTGVDLGDATGEGDYTSAKVLQIGKSDVATTIDEVFASAAVGEVIIEKGPIAKDDVKNTIVQSVTFPQGYNTVSKITINGKYLGAPNATNIFAAAKDATEYLKNVAVTVGDSAHIVGKLTMTGDVTVPAAATINGLSTTGNITLNGTSTSDSYSIFTTKGDITINGEVKFTGTGNYSVQTNEGNITVNAPVGKGIWTKKGNIIVTDSISGNAMTDEGNVTIARTTEGVAVGDSVIMKKDGTFTLSGGYVNILDCRGNAITVANEETVPTAIKTITSATKIKHGVSKWCGAAITRTGTDPFAAYAPNAAANDSIYTASQLASYTGAVAQKLAVNIDLGTNAFTPIANLASEKSFDGNNKYIKGGVVTYKATQAADPATAYVGLFQTVAANVSNLTIDGLSITAETVKIGDATKTAVVGALAGKATGGTILNVNVKNVELSSDALMVGGLIGEIAGNVTITGAAQGVAPADQFSTVAADITGKNNLGGLVGKITSGTVAITLYKAVPTFAITTQTIDGRNADLNFGTIAPFVGTAAAGTITIGGTAGIEADLGFKNTAALTDAQRTALNFKANWVKDGDDFYDFYGRKAIGFVPTSVSATIKIGADAGALLNKNQNAATAEAAKTAADAVTATSTGLNIFVKE